MATAQKVDGLTAIGAAAGKVWHLLRDEGPLSFPRIAREIDESRDLAMQAVGWLAREGKVEVNEGPRGRTVALIQEDTD